MTFYSVPLIIKENRKTVGTLEFQVPLQHAANTGRLELKDAAGSVLSVVEDIEVESAHGEREAKAFGRQGLHDALISLIEDVPFDKCLSAFGDDAWEWSQQHAVALQETLAAEFEPQLATAAAQTL